MDILSSNPYTGITSKFSQSFQMFIKDLGDAKSKFEEDRVISKEIGYLKETLTKPGITSKIQKECIIRLLHCEMLGHDASFSYMEAVKFAQQQNLLEKRVAYVALGQFLDEKNEIERMMNMSSIQRDLKSTNIMQVCFGLIASSRLVYKDMLPAVLPTIAELMKHKREVVRKKAVMAMFKFYTVDPESVRSSGYVDLFHNALCDKDPAVMAASLNAYHKLVTDSPSSHKQLTAAFVTIWTQILNRKLPEDFNYRSVPCPWMQIKILQILALLGCDDMNESKKMYEILRQCLDVTDTEETIGCAVVYECMKTIATIYPNRALVEAAANKAGLYLVASNNNLKYLGITTLSNLIHIDISYGTRHQIFVIDCLNDQDESLKRRTLELLYRMTNTSNVKVICERLISYLRSTVDEYIKSDLVTRITTLAEKFSPDNEWYINTMNEVFELGGDLVQVEVAYNMMRMIGEGIDDEEDEEDDATDDLRRNAVIAYVDLMGKQSLPDILIQLICWVVGEYIDLLQNYDVEDVLEKFYQMLTWRFADATTQSWVVTAIMKVLVATKEARKHFREIDETMLSNDARQRYTEMKTMLRTCQDLDSILPFDASCEDIEIDTSLSFLDAFVNEALQRGASPYSVENKQYLEHVATENEHEQQPSLVYSAYPKPAVYRQFKQDTPPTKQEHVDTRASTSSTSSSSSSRPTSGRSKTPLWTREGLKKSQVSDSSDSEKSTPVSSLSGSVKVEERSGSGQEKESTPEITEKKQTKMLDPDEERKKRMAEELFGMNTPQKTNKNSLANRDKRDKLRKRNLKREVKEKDLLDITDRDDSPTDALPQSDSNILTGRVTDKMVLVSTAKETVNPPQRNNQASETELSAERDLFSDLNITSSETQQLPFVTQQPDTQLPAVSQQLTSLTQNMSTTEQQIAPQQATVCDSGVNQLQNNSSFVNLLDDDDLTTQPLSSNISTETALLSSQTDTKILAIPDVFAGFPVSSNPTEICKDVNLRMMCQYVYLPTELAIILYILNQSVKPLSNIRMVIKLPSNLRGKTDELKFDESTLDGLGFCRHTLKVIYQSPALHMVLSGHVSYRDTTNTEKRLFISHVLPMSNLLRPNPLEISEFEDKWRDRALYEKKEKLNKTFDVDSMNLFLESVNIHPIQHRGNQVVCATTVLQKLDILLHFKMAPQMTEVWIKSGSRLLNDCVMRLLISIS